MARVSSPIHKLPSGRWQVRYRDNADTQRKRTFATAREAQEFLDTTRTAVRSGTYVAPQAGRERFAEFAQRWAQGQDWKFTTRESALTHLRRLQPYLGDHRLDQIDELVLAQVRARLVEDYAMSVATVGFHYACAPMRAAYRSGRISRDPTVALGAPRRRDGTVEGVARAEQIPTRAELVAILSAAPDRFRAAIMLGACGLRVGEVLGVTVNRLELDTGALLVDRQLQHDGLHELLNRPKREKVRRIGLPGWARLELRRHLRDHGPFWALSGGRDAGEGLLFRGDRGGALRRSAFYNAAWWPTLRAAGLDGRGYVFHSLRHWCASSMLAEGAPITAVAGHLGDTVETVSRTYAHWLRDDRHVPAAILDRLLAPDVRQADSG